MPVCRVILPVLGYNPLLNISDISFFFILAYVLCFQNSVTVIVCTLSIFLLLKTYMQFLCSMTNHFFMLYTLFSQDKILYRLTQNIPLWIKNVGTLLSVLQTNQHTVSAKKYRAICNYTIIPVICVRVSSDYLQNQKLYEVEIWHVFCS